MGGPPFLLQHFRPHFLVGDGVVQVGHGMLRAGITLESVSGKLDYIIASRLDLSAGQQEAVVAAAGGTKPAAGGIIS